ncbi:MAG: hypothetical protein RLZZ292_1178, partial [Bacteroidota bacterium]
GFFFFFFSCSPSGVPLTSKPSANNKTYQVEYLFEHDGCKVYRFYDGYYVYFTNCKGEAVAVKQDTSHLQYIKNETQIKLKNQ